MAKKTEFYLAEVAETEGWFLAIEYGYFSKGLYRIRMEDFQDRFETDEEAVEYVRKRARHSKMHQEAISLHGCPI